MMLEWRCREREEGGPEMAEALGTVVMVLALAATVALLVVVARARTQWVTR